MTSRKIFQLSRPPLSSSKLLPPLDLEPPVSNEPPPPSPNDIQSIKRKNNPRMAIICYQVLPSGRLTYSVSTH